VTLRIAAVLAAPKGFAVEVRHVAALAAVLVLAAPAPAATAPAPARVQVSAKEFFFSLSRHKVFAGPAIVELVNFGEDPHDLRLQRAGGGRVWKTPLVYPGAYYDLDATLVPGRYRLWCSIGNHRKLGMAAVLTVIPRK
jgi:plastocyanin